MFVPNFNVTSPITVEIFHSGPIDRSKIEDTQTNTPFRAGFYTLHKDIQDMCYSFCATCKLLSQLPSFKSLLDHTMMPELLSVYRGRKTGLTRLQSSRKGGPKELWFSTSSTAALRCVPCAVLKNSNLNGPEDGSKAILHLIAKLLMIMCCSHGSTAGCMHGEGEVRGSLIQIDVSHEVNAWRRDLD